MASSVGVDDYALTRVPDPTGKIVSSPGRYVTVWKKDDAGRWRCAIDFWNEAPAAASDPKK